MEQEMIISEKAIAGARIAEILAEKGKVKTSSKGYSQVFEFDSGGKHIVVVPLRGHIVEVNFPTKYSNWIGTDLKLLVKAEVEYQGTEANIISLLKQFAAGSSKVIIATDNDREGESIGVEALRYITENNPKINITRAYFSAITPKEINAAFAQLTKVDFNFADSADARREIDLIWGAVLTRFLSIVSGRMGKDYLSVGRVQSPTLAIIVDREKERQAFQAKAYWELLAQCEKDKMAFEASHKEGRFWEKEKAEKAFAAVKDAKIGIVEKVFSKKRTLSKPTPFNTNDFLRASTVLGLTAGQAMNIGESLYMRGFISYPRTDNTEYPESLDLKETLTEIKKNKEFAVLVDKLLALPKLIPSKGSKISKDHPPIHPVSAPEKSKLSDREWKVYELVVRRFLATLAEDAITENTSVELIINREPFTATGQIILKAGWKEYYPYSQIKETILPKLEKGYEVKITKTDLLAKETIPPARYSQSSLLKLMEEKNLGTKSTRHSIIQKLYDRGYISGLKSIEPNKIAFAVIDSLQKHCKTVTEAEMTSSLEGEMDFIAAGKKPKLEVVVNSRNLLNKILDDLLVHRSEIGSDLRRALVSDTALATCPTCKGRLLIRKGKSGKRFLGCSSYPKCTTTFPLPQKGNLASNDKPCPVCGKPTIKLIGKRFKLEMCLDMSCPSKDEWKRKSAEKKAALEAKAAQDALHPPASPSTTSAASTGSASSSSSPAPVKKPRKSASKTAAP